MKFSVMKNIADRVYSQLVPHCESGKCFIAGSIRREQKECTDVEIVCLPKRYQVAVDMFTQDASFAPIDEFIKAVNQWEGIKGNARGRNTKRIYKHKNAEVMLDIFIPTKEDFFRQLAIRTGSAQYSHLVIATAWVKLGWVGTENGLRRRDECIKENGNWLCVSINPKLPPVWESEEEFFNFLQIPYVEPKERKI